MDNKDQLKRYLQKYLKDRASADETKKIDDWYESISDPQLDLNGSEKAEIRSRMLNYLQSKMTSDKRVIPLNSAFIWKVAASLLLFTAIGMWVVRDKTDIVIPGFEPYAQKNSSIINIENVTAYDEEITLPDGSEILLKPKGKLSYINTFDGDKREVNLIGEAFFDIAKDPHRPFYVYGSSVVTKVLGTSFWVIAPENAKEVEVKVKSGRVSVYEIATQGNSSPNQKHAANGVVLMPNQQVTYFVEEQHWVTSLVEAPLPVEEIIDEENRYKYEDASLNEVIKTLEADYGIEFIMDKEDVSSCRFTGDISAISLFDKLTIICKSLQLTYEIKGTKILINGAGCM